MKSSLRLAFLLTVAVPGVASAHIHLLQPKSRTDLPTGDQKERHCGLSTYSRAAHPERVTWFKPGETIRVAWQETVNHPGWYRISFQPNGEEFAYPPPSNGPTADGTPSNFPTVNQTGVTDPATGATVLLDRIADGAPGTTQMADVTLPNIECNNCTLQFTEFMTDRSQYDNVNGGAVYFNCADIVISNSPQPVPPDAGPMDGDTDRDAGNPVTGDGGGLKGGCSAGGSTGIGALAMVGLLGLRRRRAARTA